MNCKNCNYQVTSKFCPNCGHPTELKRISGKYIIHEIEHVLHLEKGIFYTIKELFIRPGHNVRTYLTENRSRLVKPVIFIIITSLIYTVCNHIFHIEDGYVQFQDNQPSATKAIFKWVQEHYGYSNIIMGVFIALWIKLFFRKFQYNFFEILILLCFVMGIGMLIYAFFGIIQGLTSISLGFVGGIVGVAYTTWAIGLFYGKKKVINYVKAFFAYILGMISFSLVAVIIGGIIDAITRH